MGNATTFAHTALAWLRTTTPWPTDSASFWTMIQGVFVSLTVLYAGRQLAFSIKTERRRQTSDLTQEYYARIAPDRPSPSDAGITLKYNDTPLGDAKLDNRLLLEAWVIMSNYVDKVDTLLSNKMIDEGLYMEHMYELLGNAILQYDKWKNALLDDYVDSTMWGRMRKRVNKARKRHGYESI